MSDYQRTTRECSFTQIRPELFDAIRQHIEEHHLGNVESELLICCETTSERKKAGLLTSLKDKLMGLPAPGSIQYSAAVVTPKWLIWAITDIKHGVLALSVRLTEAEISDYDAKLVEDYGINILGFSTGATKRSLKFLGLGRGPASEKFKSVLKQAMEEANNLPESSRMASGNR